jgi:tripartite ATP-independent transporter DctM subunit
LNILKMIIRGLDKVAVFSRWTNIVGMACFFLMVLVNFVDVIARYFFHNPLTLILDLTGLMMLTGVFLAVSYTYAQGSHVGIDLITSKLKPKIKLAWELTTSILALIIMAFLIWSNYSEFRYTIDSATHVSQSLYINRSPFMAILIIGLITFWLLILRDIFNKIVEAIKLKFGLLHWLSIIVVSALVIVFAVIWMQPKLIQMSLPMVGLIGVVIFLFFLFSGTPIAFGLIITGFICISHIRGFSIAMNMLGTEPYINTTSYSWSVMAFFILMGYLAFYARFGEDLYYAANRWIGHFRGGLALATVVACTGLAAIVGDSASCVATMSSIARPEMKKYGYDDRLTAGAICGGATLGPIIPPSVPFIVYGVLTSVPIGTLFIAGIIPGVIMAIFFCIVIIFWTRINPNVGPAAAKSTWRRRIVSLKAGGPVLVLFIFVIGGMFAGMFTPTEGGAMGAAGIMIMGLLLNRFRWKNFSQALVEAGKVTSIIFLILVGAVLFTRFGVWCNLSTSVSSLLSGLGLSPIIIIGIVYVAFFLLGFIVDTLPLTLIGVPIVHPIAVVLGFDPIWFAVVLVCVINVGTITPPVAICLFIMKALNPDMPIGVIFKGAMPFVIATFATILIIFFIPSLVTWLPNLVK